MSLRSLSSGRISSTVSILSSTLQHCFSSLRFLRLESSFITTQWLGKISHNRRFSVSALLRAGGTFWTDEEDSTLQKLAHEDVPLADIAKELNRTVEAIYARQRLLDLNFQGPVRKSFKPWSQEEDLQARALLEKGMSRAATAAAIGRSIPALRSRLWYVGTKRPDPSYRQAAGRDTIARETVDKAIKMRSCGLSWSKIQAAIPEHKGISLRSAWRKHLENGRLQDQPCGARWTDGESELLLHLRGDRKLPWSSIQRHIPGRSVGALRIRYNTIHGPQEWSLPPKYTLNELELIAKLKAGFYSWQEIAAHLPGRSVTTLKTIYCTRVADGYSIAPDGSVQWTKEWKARNRRLFLENEKSRDSDVNKDS